MSLIDDVSAVVARIPAGQVWTYADVAAALGFRAARHNKEIRTAIERLVRDQGRNVPWWRVVALDGSLVTGNHDVQQAMLGTEGVVADERVDLERYGRSTD